MPAIPEVGSGTSHRPPGAISKWECRIRISVSNPCVSFRISQADLTKLRQLESLTGQSRGQILRENLGIAARDQDAGYTQGWSAGFDEGRQAGRDEGREQGRKEVIAEGCYTLKVPCNSCGKPVALDFTVKGFGDLYWRCSDEVLKGIRHKRCP